MLHQSSPTCYRASVRERRAAAKGVPKVLVEGCHLMVVEEVEARGTGVLQEER